MKEIKYLMLVALIASTLCLLLLLWNENSVSIDGFTLKLIETMFLVVALATAREYYSIRKDH